MACIGAHVKNSRVAVNLQTTHLPLCCLAALQILICQNLRNNLQHPNEYIRGVTLRFLCRIKVSCICCNPLSQSIG